MLSGSTLNTLANACHSEAHLHVIKLISLVSCLIQNDVILIEIRAIWVCAGFKCGLSNFFSR